MKYTITAYQDTDKTTVMHVIVFDAVVNGSENYSNEITSHVVEDGGVINDHVIKNKDKISVEGVVSDLSFNQGESGIVTFNILGDLDYADSDNYSQTIKNNLREINDKGFPCSVKTSFTQNGEEVIDNDVFPCLIESLDLSNSGGQFGSIQPKITFVPVRIVGIEFVELTAEQEATPALKREADLKRSSANAKSGSTETTVDPTTGKEVPLDLTTTPDKETEGGLFSKAKDYIGTTESRNKALQATADKLYKIEAELGAEVEARR